jgi:hypothetical protein
MAAASAAELARTDGAGMSVLSTADLVDALHTAGVIDPTAPPPPDTAHDRPWYLALVQGFAGWLSGILLLCFIGLLIRPDSTATIVVLGVGLTGGAWALYFIDRKAVFLDQLALAISIAGQLALAWGILRDVDSPAVGALVLFGLQCVVFFVMPNHVARVVATLFACIAWAYFARFALWPGYGRASDFFFDSGGARIPVFGVWTMPIVWLLTWGPMIALMITLIAREPRWMSSGIRALARPALTGVLLGAAVGGFAAEPLWFMLFGSGFESMNALPITWWSLFPLLSIALTLLAAHCAFRLRSMGLLGVAIFAALMRLSLFYYQYGSSLLAKSAIMLALGVALLAGGMLLRKRLDEAP